MQRPYIYQRGEYEQKKKNTKMYWVSKNSKSLVEPELKFVILAKYI